MWDGVWDPYEDDPDVLRTAKKRVAACPYCSRQFVQRKGDVASGEQEWFPDYCLRGECDRSDIVLADAERSAERRERSLVKTAEWVIRRVSSLVRVLGVRAPDKVVTRERTLLLDAVEELLRRDVATGGHRRAVDPHERPLPEVDRLRAGTLMRHATPGTLAALVAAERLLEEAGMRDEWAALGSLIDAMRAVARDEE